MNWRFWRRRPSTGLKEAQRVYEEVASRRQEVDEIAKSLKRRRERNGLAPLIEQALRSNR